MDIHCLHFDSCDWGISSGTILFWIRPNWEVASVVFGEHSKVAILVGRLD